VDPFGSGAVEEAGGDKQELCGGFEELNCREPFGAFVVLNLSLYAERSARADGERRERCNVSLVSRSSRLFATSQKELLRLVLARPQCPHNLR